MHVLEAATDETLRVEDRVLGVHSSLVLGGITNQALLSRESDVGGRCPVTLYTDVKISPQGDVKKCSRSLAMISTRSFCQTPTQLQTGHQ